MKETEKDNKTPVTHTAASSQSLTSKKKFSWLFALPVVILVALVGVVIVINTFAATRSQTYVVSLYRDLLGRTVTASDSGVQYWAKKIDSGTSETAVRTAIYNSGEAQRHRAATGGSTGSSATTPSASSRSANSTVTKNQADVIKLYKDLLDRTVTASDSGVQYWVKKLDGGTSLAAVEKAIKATSEYKSKHPSASGKSSASSGQQTTDYATELKWLQDQCARLKLSCDPKGNDTRAKTLVAKKTTRVKLLAYFEDAARKAQKTTAQLNPEQCRKRLIKDFDVQDYETIDKKVEWWVRDQYRHYQGYAGGYQKDLYTNQPGYIGTGEGLGAAGEAVKQKLIDCAITKKEAIAMVKAEDGTKKFTDEKQAYFNTYVLPVAKALQGLLKQAIAAKGGTYTCWTTSKKTGKSVDALNSEEFANTMPPSWCFAPVGLVLPDGNFDALLRQYRKNQDIGEITAAVSGGAAGFCEAGTEILGGTIGGTEDYASCSSGSGFYTQADLAQANASRGSSSDSTSSGQNTSTPTYGASSGTMVNSR